MPRGGIEHSERESKVERVIRLAYEETKKRLVEALAPVEGDYTKLNDALIHIRDLVELLIGIRVGDHPICDVSAPRDFFAQAGAARSGEIKELVGGERLVALLAQYDEVSAIAVPLRAAIADVDRLMGKEPSEPAARAGRGESEDGMLPRHAKARAKIRAAIIAEFRKSDVFINSRKFYERLGCSILTSRREIAEMVKEGLLEVRGSGPSTRYVLTLKGRAEIRGDGVGRGTNGAGAEAEGEGVMLGTFRYNGPHPAIARAICEKLQTGAAFVNSRAFCEEADCHSPTSLQVVVALIEAGILTKEGNGRASIYPLTPRGKSLIRA